MASDNKHLVYHLNLKLNYKTDISSAISIASSTNRKHKMVSKSHQLKSKRIRSIRVSNTNMSSNTATFTSNTYESLAYTTTNSKAATTFSTPITNRRCPSTRLNKQKILSFNQYKSELNQTIFEPKHSSTPFGKEQKTSTPNFNKSNESKFQNTQFQQVSRLNTQKDLYYFTSLSSEYYSDLRMMTSSRYINPLAETNNKLVVTSTPKSSRYFNLTKSVVKATKIDSVKNAQAKKLNFNENLVKCNSNNVTIFDNTNSNNNNVSTVTTVIKCCIKPFKNLIKSNKTIKKLYF